MASVITNEIEAEAALANLNSAGRRSYFPRRFRESRTRHRIPPRAARTVFPSVQPGFTFERGCRIFTIGSCFAREIEENLPGYDLPTLALSLPTEEWNGRRNGALNEYNPGSIAQRIDRAFHALEAPRDTIVSRGTRGFVDLLLPGDVLPATEERAFARRKEIDDIYAALPSADVLIVTLGLIEAWYDRETGVYLNRIPPSQQLEDSQERYVLRVLDVDDAYPLLEAAFELVDAAEMRVVLTVSPVPLYATFTGEDAVVANSLSKSVLRVCAHRLAQRFPRVDYFPSYEIVSSGGVASFVRDQLHVKSDIVSQITRYMTTSYEGSATASR